RRTGRRQATVAEDEELLTSAAPALRRLHVPAGLAAGLVAAPAVLDVAIDPRRRIRLPTRLPRLALGAGVRVLLGWILLPIIWILIASLQPESAITVAPPQLHPSVNLGWYQYLVGTERFVGSFWVSVILALSVMVLT